MFVFLLLIYSIMLYQFAVILNQFEGLKLMLKALKFSDLRLLDTGGGVMQE